MNREAVKLRDQAARPTRRRIRADRRSASPEVEKVLAVIEARLFDQRFDVNGLWRECGVKKWVATPFSEQLGMGPGAYISRLRLEVGAVLLGRTRLKVFQIADVLGYSAARDTFSKAFQRWSGKTPLQYRHEARVRDEPVLIEGDPEVTKLFHEIDLTSTTVDLAGTRRSLARADAVLRDRNVADLAARLALSLHERGADGARAGDVDRAYDDLSLARRCYTAAGELPPAIVRERRYVPVSHHTDEALLKALCPDCRRRLTSREGRSMRQNLRQALLLVPRDDPWFEASCDDCYRVAWSSISRARLGLMSDAWKAWWLSTHVDPKDCECPPSRGRFIAAMAEVERLASGDQLERKGYAAMAVEDAVALGDPLLEAESRLWLGAVLGAMSEFADAKEQLNSADASGDAPWLSALRSRVTGLLEYYRTNYPKAIQLLESSTKLYNGLDKHVTGLLVIQQANVHFDVADYETCTTLNQTALTFLDDRRDPLPGAAAVPINLASAFALLGNWERAELALAGCRFDRQAHRGWAATEVFTHACLELLRRRASASLVLFEDAQSRFQKLHIPRGAALAATYSIEAHIRMGDRMRAVETALTAFRFFEAAGCKQDTIDAIGKLRSLLEANAIDATKVAAKVRQITRLHGGWLPEAVLLGT